MKVGGLFSGIGGFELGLSRAGFEISWMVEIDEFCRKVLKKHAPEYWPNARILEDVTKVGKEQLAAVDLICGGFPCQPFSQAGKRRGKEDDRYLWPEMLRIISELKPRWIIGENVAGFINMELENAFTDLEAEGYKVEAFVLPVAAIGGWHRRDRVWIIAYGNEVRCNLRRFEGEGIQWQYKTRDEVNTGSKTITNSNSKRLQKRIPQRFRSVQQEEATTQGSQSARIYTTTSWGEFPTQPYLCRGNDGISNRMDRVRSLGNAVVPQIPEILGRFILEIENDLFKSST